MSTKEQTKEQKIKDAFPELRNHQQLLRSMMVFLTEANKIAVEISSKLDGGDQFVIEINRLPGDTDFKESNDNPLTSNADPVTVDEES